MARADAIELTALEHIHELMRRMLWSVIFLVCGGALAYVFRLEIIEFLQRPLHQQLYYTSPMGSFQFVMQICLLCGVLCSLPVLLYHLLRFIEPAFTKEFSRRMVLTLLTTSFLLTIAGAAFAYYVTLPPALKFFSLVGTNQLRPLISVNEYFSFILGYLTTFALVFQLPLVLLFIDRIHPIDPGILRKKRTIVYIGAFAISLIMPSSPDPLSQVSLAIPIIVLYEFSTVLIARTHRKKLKKAAKVAKKLSFDTVEPIAPTEEPAAPVINYEAKEEGVVNLSKPTPVVEAVSVPKLKSRGHSIDGITRPTRSYLPRAVDPPATRQAAYTPRMPSRTPQKLISDFL